MFISSYDIKRDWTTFWDNYEFINKNNIDTETKTI